MASVEPVSVRGGAPGIAAEVSGRVEGRSPDVFDFFREVDLPRILTGLGPLPAVVSVDNPGDRWDEPGQRRTLHLADGSSLRETMTEVWAPSTFAYEIEELTGPLLILVGRISGRWFFESGASEAETGSTAVRWHYIFEPHSWLTWLPSFLIVRLLWQPYMGRVLARTTMLANRELTQG
jgi:hypothetical protein